MRIRSLKLACSTLNPTRFPHSPWKEIAISGRSNVGKSSLLNTLLGRRNFARISKDPGRTRSVNFYLLNDRFYFVDLPGYGYAKVSEETRRQWKRVILDYIENRDAIGGVIQLVDSRHLPTRDDLLILQMLLDCRRPFIVAFTKADKISKSERQRVLQNFCDLFEDASVKLYGSLKDPVAHRTSPPGDDFSVPAVFFSSKTGEGKDALWRWIGDVIL